MAKEVTVEILFPAGTGGLDSRTTTGVLDIYESQNFPMSIQYCIKNITNLNESQGSYTKTFDIPATKHNNQLLKNAIKDNLASQHVVVFVDASIKCRVRVSGQVVLTGNFTIKSYLKSNKEEGYTITILGDNNNWTEVMNGKMMCEILEAQLNQTHEWNNSLWNWYNINRKVDDATYPSGLPTYEVCIPHICWGEYGSSHAPATWKKMMLMENTPSFFIKNLVYAYFLEAGYTVVSSFMNTKFFKKLIMPTDPLRFNHGNYQTLGGGTQVGEVIIAEANFYNETGQGVGVDAIFPCGSTWYPCANYQWTDCLETNQSAFWNGFPASTTNHHRPLAWVKWSYVPPIADMYWGQRIAPFNEEIVDLYNVQDCHTRQHCENTNFPDQLRHKAGSKQPQIGGETHTYDTYPMQWHRWVCPTTADYTIEVYGSFGLWKQDTAVSDGRAKVQMRLLMIENASGWNYTDNSTPNNYASTMGTSTVLDDAQATTPNNAAWRTLTYKELDIVWTGTIPAGAHIVVEMRNVNKKNTDFFSEAIVLDRDFTKWDAAWEMVGMTGTKARETKFRIKTGNQINYGDDVTWKEYLPCDITQKAFISGLTGLFNLYWYTDEIAKKVYVEPYEDFFKTKGEAVNWSKKMDLSKPHQTQFLADIIGRNALYRYQPPSKDGYQETLNKTLAYPYASQFVDLGAQYLNKTTEYGTSLFVPTIMIKDNELVELIDPNPPWIPLIIQTWLDDVGNFPKPERSDGYGIRILSYEGMQSTDPQLVWGDWAGAEVDEYPRAVSYCETSVPQSGQEHANLQYHDVENGGTQAGLFTTYFDTLFQDLIALPRMKIAYFHLTPVDIAQLDLRKLVYITEDGGGNGSYWKIHKIIDYKPHEDDLTKVELLQYQIKDKSKPKLVDGGNSSNSLQGTQEVINEHGVFSQGSANIVANTTGETQYFQPPLRKQIQKSLVLRGQNEAPKDNGNVLLGNGLTTRLQNQIVLGQFNKQDNNAILIVGGGTDENNRRNVLTVKQDGSIHLGGDSDNLVTKDDTGAYIDLYTEDTDEYDNTIINKVR